MEYSDKGLAEAIENKNINEVTSILSSCAGVDRNGAARLIAASSDFQFIRECYDAINNEEISNEIVKASFITKDIGQFKDIWGKNQDSWKVAIREYKKRGNDDFTKIINAYSSNGGSVKDLFLSLYTEEMIDYIDSEVKYDEKLGPIFDVASGKKGIYDIRMWRDEAICHGATLKEVGECKAKALVERVKRQKTSLHISPSYISAEAAFTAIKDIVSEVSKSRADSVIPNLCAIYLNEGGYYNKLLDISEELEEIGKYSLSNIVKDLVKRSRLNEELLPVLVLG